jgi:hypothetical protein
MLKKKNIIADEELCVTEEKGEPSVSTETPTGCESVGVTVVFESLNQ